MAGELIAGLPPIVPWLLVDVLPSGFWLIPSPNGSLGMTAGSIPSGGCGSGMAEVAVWSIPVAPWLGLPGALAEGETIGAAAQARL